MIRAGAVAVALALLVAPEVASACASEPADARRLACYDAAAADLRFLRCTDMLGTAACEVLAPRDAQMIACVALDAAGTPIAQASGFVGTPVLFTELEASRIARLDCRVLH